MKKLIIAAAFVAVGFGANAQVKFGIKAGLNIANLTGDFTTNTSSLASFNAGGLVNIPISSAFSVQPEVLYSGEGAKVSGSGGGKILINYVNVPVLFQYNNSGFFGELGPQIGLLTSAKTKVSGSTLDVKDQLKSTNFSLAFGGGYKLLSGLGFNVRYNLGLSNIADNSSSGSIKTSTLAVGALYTFKSSKK